MSDFNRVILLGHIGNKLELKNSGDGKPYLHISLATNAYRGSSKITDWHRVMVFGSQAEICSTYLKKGANVLVEGSLGGHTYTNKDGQKVKSVSVLAKQICFITPLNGEKKFEEVANSSSVAEEEMVEVSTREDSTKDSQPIDAV